VEVDEDVAAMIGAVDREWARVVAVEVTIVVVVVAMTEAVVATIVVAMIEEVGAPETIGVAQEAADQATGCAPPVVTTILLIAMNVTDVRPRSQEEVMVVAPITTVRDNMTMVVTREAVMDPVSGTTISEP